MPFNTHPFFVIDLLQMCRHGEHEQAAATAAEEVLHVVSERRRAGIADDDTDPGGVVMLPTLQRQRELGYRPPEPPQHDHQERPDAPRF